MAETIDKFSDQMIARYFKTYFSAWDVYRAAVNAYERRKLDGGVTMQQRNDIEVELLWLHGEHAKLMQRRTAFLRGALAINRPSTEQFDTVTALSEQADELTDAAANLDTLTDMAIDVSEIMASVHNENGGEEERQDA